MKDKTLIIAKFHSTDLIVCSLGRGKPCLIAK